MTASDMKWYIDWLGLRGVNLFIPHAFYYSVTGERKEERPPDVGITSGGRITNGFRIISNGCRIS